MAKPTEQRVNKAFVAADLDRPAIDPGTSDVSEDRSYDRIEELRAEHAAAGATENVQTVDTPPNGRDLMTGTEDPGLIESMRLERWEAEQREAADLRVDTQGYDAGTDLHAEHSADIHAAHGAADVPSTAPDEGPLDIQDGFTPQ